MTKIKERLHKSVILFSVLLLLLGGFSFFRGAELLKDTPVYSATIETLDEKRGTVMGMTAALVGTSTLITGLPDDIGTPVAEQLMDMTDWLLLVLCVVFLEKYGITMLWAGVFKGMIPLACILGIADLTGVKQNVRRVWQRLLLLSLALTVTIPLGVYAANMIEKTYETSITELADDGDELAQMMEADTEEKENWLQRIFVKAKDSAEAQLEKGKEVLVRYTEQVAVMLVTSCMVPIAVLLFLFWLVRMILGVEVQLPARPKFTKHLKKD